MPMSLGTVPRVLFVLILTALTGALTVAPSAQAQADPAGTWKATVASPMGDVEVTLTLEKSGDAWTGSIQGQQGSTQLTDIKVVGNLIEFEIPNEQMNITARFSGSLDSSGDRLIGSANVPSMPQAPAQEFTFVRQVDEVTDPNGGKKYRVGSGPAGVWIGAVRAPDGEDSQVTLTLDKVGTEWAASIEDPFVEVVRGENVKVTDSMISFTFRPDGAPFPSHFSGTYIAADDRVTGSFSQRGTSRFVKFRRDPDTVTLGMGPDGQPILPPRVRHPYKFAVAGRLSYWASLHVVKDEVYNLNTLTESALNYDATVKYFLLDSFSLFLRGFRGGQGITSDAARLAPYEEIGLSGDSYLKLDGFEFGMTGYLGNIMAKNSRFNPFLTGAVGYASWELTASGRGSEILSLDDNEFSGSDLCVAFGLGTEYELNDKMSLEFEWLWRYFMTEDETKWAPVDDTWSNTHAWSLSFGLAYGLF
jgi:hypothetical protein